MGVYADKAYASKEHERYLKKRGVKSCILKKAYRNRPLTPEDIKMNRLHSAVRSGVESVFGILKLHFGLRKARYLGIALYHVRFVLCSIAYNFKRALTIQKACR